MNLILFVFLVAVALLSGCAAQPSNTAHTERVMLECTHKLNVQTNENGVQIKFWDTKCRETSKKLLPQ